MSDEVWIRTTPTLDGETYVVTLEINEDTARTMTPDAATAYGYGLLEAVERACYDAAVLRQLKSLNLDRPTVGQMLTDMRADRPPLDHTRTDPLQFAPGVNTDGKPFLTISHDGKPIGQWDIEPAREHALAMQAAVANADLDAAYLRTLVGLVGIDEPRARNVVEDIVNWRP